MLHGIKNIKIINAQQANITYNYKNTTEKFLKQLQQYGSIKFVLYVQVVGF
jgi:ribosomal protein L13